MPFSKLDDSPMFRKQVSSSSPFQLYNSCVCAFFLISSSLLSSIFLGINYHPVSETYKETRGRSFRVLINFDEPVCESCKPSFSFNEHFPYLFHGQASGQYHFGKVPLMNGYATYIHRPSVNY